MAYLGWDEVDQGQKGKGSRKGGKDGGGKFMKLGANETYRVRPVHKPIRFFKFYNDHPKGFRSATVENPDSHPVKDIHPEVRIGRRYAIVVIDRDDNKMKILEGPVSIFEEFKKFYDITKEEPGGNAGGDFTIEVVCPNNKKDRDTSYVVSFDGKAPFSEEERALITENKEEFNLPEIYKPHSDEEIEQRLFSDEWPPKQDDAKRESNSAPASTQAASAPAAEPAVASTPAKTDDDPFNW